MVFYMVVVLIITTGKKRLSTRRMKLCALCALCADFQAI
jgi:hypothetical protein